MTSPHCSAFEHDCCDELRSLQAQLDAAQKVVEMVRRYECCEGDDARQTAQMRDALAAYDSSLKGKC